MFRKVKNLMLMLCLAAFCIVSAAKADGPAWERFEYDLARTHYYPYGSSYEISFDDFQPAWIVPVATQAVLTGDINGDGKLEVVSWDAPNIRVFDNEGQELWTVPISGFVREPSLLDATGDGVPEIAVGRRTSSDSLQILVYDGSGTLLKTIGKAGGYDSSIRPWLAADCNSDGTIEILAIQDAAWSNEPRGVSLFDYETGQELWYYDMGPQICNGAVGDIDEDGDLEVIKDAATVFNGAWGCGVNGQNTCTYDNAVATIVVDACTGDEAFTKFYSPERGWLYHAIVDLDRSGDANILCFRGHDSYYPGTMNILLLDDQGDTLSTWTYDGPENRFTRAGSWAIADVDADNREEIIVCDWNAPLGLTTDYTMRIIDDDLSQQLFVNDTVVNADNNRITINVTDLNGDGSNDILVTDYQNGKLRVLNNTLNEIWSYDAPHIQQIALSDLNGDGIPEIIVAADSLVVLAYPSQISIPAIDTCVWWKDSLGGVIVPVYASVSSPVCGLQVPISWNGPTDCELIEIEYAGTGLATWGYMGDSINNVEKFVNFGGAVGEGTPIPAGCNQLIAKLHFVYTGEGYPTEPFELTFDTTTVGPSSLLFYGCEEPVGVSIVPIVAFDTVNVLFGYLPGDANADCAANVGDAVYLLNHVFKDGPAPMPPNSGDPNADGSVNLGDAVYLINYVFKGGADPDCGNVPDDESICCGGGGEKMAKAYRLDSPAVNTRFDGEKTTIEIESAFDLYGVQFDIECVENAVITNLAQNTQLYEGHSGDQARIGLLDMKGEGYIPAGQRTILEISGAANILSALGADEKGTTVEIVIGSTEKIASLPEAFSLSQNHPNPFNPMTTISFNLPEASDVTLDVFNVAGQKVATLVDSYLEAGGHRITWDSKDDNGNAVASGIYLYRIKAGSNTDTKKMLLLK